mgnify:CR=1 FL=1
MAGKLMIFSALLQRLAEKTATLAILQQATETVCNLLMTVLRFSLQEQKVPILWMKRQYLKSTALNRLTSFKLRLCRATTPITFPAFRA